jgi:RNA recognition motif-containing protein
MPAPQLFVYGINENISNSEIQEAFSKYGNVVDTYNTGKGYAFVTYDNKEDATTVRSNHLLLFSWSLTWLCRRPSS